MSNITSKRKKRERRHRRVRARIEGTALVPRLSVFRSSRHVWAQLIDDAAARTVAAASSKEFQGEPRKTKGKKQTKDKDQKTGASKTETAEKIGKIIAERALKKKITRAVFDRGGYKYHGAVKAVAEGARKGGLMF